MINKNILKMNKKYFQFKILLLTLLISSIFAQNNSTKNKKKDEESELIKNFYKEWNIRMKDFEGQYVYMIPLEKNKISYFYENITEVPALIQGAVIIDEKGDDIILFEIKDPFDNVVYQNETHATIFNFTVETKGLYKISFNNKFSGKKISPTFTMNTGQNIFLQKKDIDEKEKSLIEVIQFLKDTETQDKMKKNIQRKRLKEVRVNNRNFFIFSMIETIILAIISVWQYLYMKHLFEIKGSL
jgi:hypothetical protein